MATPTSETYINKILYNNGFFRVIEEDNPGFFIKLRRLMK